MLTRRSLLAGIPFLPIIEYLPPLLSPAVIEKKGEAAIAAAVSQVPEAVYTGSDGWFYNPGTSGLPSSANNVTISYLWNSTIRPGDSGTEPIGVVLSIVNPSTSVSITVEHFRVSPESTGLGVNATENSPRPQTLQLSAPVAGNLPYDGRWHWNVINIDTQNMLITALVDAVPVGTSQSSGAPFRLTLNNPVSVAGAGGSPYLPWMGLAEFAVIASDTYLNINDPNVIAAFIDPATGYPRRIPANGQIPIIDRATGSTISILQAQIALSGNPDTWYLNRPSRTTDTTHMGIVTRSPNDPAQFRYMGSISEPPFSDAWGA